MASIPKKISTGQQIVNWEGRRDKNGNLTIYNLPSNDGGGRYEVAGINEKYDPKKAAELAILIKSGKHKEAEKLAAAYIEENTKGVDSWTKNPALNFYLRDTAFNRGNTGAAKILQMALGVKNDGKVGPITKAALKKAENDPGAFLDALNKARADYEYKVVGKRANLDQGLRNRWAKALEYSKGLNQG